MPIHKNTAHDIPFILLDKKTGTILTGADVTGYRVFDGGSQSPVDGLIQEKGNGQYLLEGAISDFNANYSVGFLFISDDGIPVHVLLQMTYFRKNTAYAIPFLLLNASSGSPLIGASPSGIRCLDGGSQEAVDGVFVERGNGQYVFQATANDFAVNDIAGFLITATNAMPIHLILDLLEPYSVTESTDHTPALILATYITSQGLMTVPNFFDEWPLYVSAFPDVENAAGCAFNTTPIKDGRAMSSGEVYQHYGVELMIRSETEEIGWVKCKSILGNLDAVNNQLVIKDSVTYQINTISRMGGINCLGQDTKRRYLFSINLIMSLNKVS